MRVTYMEELKFLRMLPLHLMSQSWRPWLLGMLALVLLLVKVKFEVKLLILMMMMMMWVVFDCLVDYHLFCFSFKLVSCILISEHHGMFYFQTCGLYLIYKHHVVVIIYYYS